ncbi:ras suppressor protein 1 [Gracilinanus agilis]|uniref:ras suppressor protein 1 n=1 Tax=Gracilinanus agilis TaxID=191870 RepID=UPI001CFE6F8E|nr:ras suppressor protein 1 [Gracilinanus agilis]
MSKSLKKLVEESREKNQPEVDMCDRGISNMLDVHGLFTLSHITQLVLSHNKLTRGCCVESLALLGEPGAACSLASLPLGLHDAFSQKQLLSFLDAKLALAHQVVEKVSIQRAPSENAAASARDFPLDSAVPAPVRVLRPLAARSTVFLYAVVQLRHLGNSSHPSARQAGGFLAAHPHSSAFEVGSLMNRLNTLPRGFGSLPALEVLDLTYNNLNENSLPGNFFYLTTLRALYLSDNDFEILPPDIGKLTKLQILSLRDNDLISLPKETGDLTQLKELHIQGNRLTVLPPELGNLDLTGQKQVFKAENNPWVTPIADQFQLGVSHVFEYIRSETYKYLYGRHMQANPEPPKKNNDKSKKISRKPLTAKNK